MALLLRFITLSRFRGGIAMLQDVIFMLLIIVVVPLCSIVVLGGIAKKKRQRRPVQYFRPN